MKTKSKELVEFKIDPELVLDVKDLYQVIL